MALIFIAIYVGAIAVLFIFVILMIDIKPQNTSNRSFSYSYMFFLSLIILFEIITLIVRNFQINSYYNAFYLTNNFQNWLSKLDILTDIEVLGQVLSTNYVLQLLISGLVLFLGVLGSIVLTLNLKKNNPKQQFFFRQLSKNFRNSLIH